MNAISAVSNATSFRGVKLDTATAEHIRKMEPSKSRPVADALNSLNKYSDECNMDIKLTDCNDWRQFNICFADKNGAETKQLKSPVGSYRVLANDPVTYIRQLKDFCKNESERIKGSASASDALSALVDPSLDIKG